MKQNYHISIFLDTRRPKASGKFPLKLRIYTGTPRRQKLYPTIFELSEAEYHSAWLTTKPKGDENKLLRKQLQAIEVGADEVAKGMKPFNFELFEKKLFRQEGDGSRLAYLYNQKIAELVRSKQLGTAGVYEYSQKWVAEFIEHRGRKFAAATLYDITLEWLQSFEDHMADQGRSLTSVSMHLRALRTIYRKAIEDNEIEPGYYPFTKYQIPDVKGKKRALSKDQLKALFKTSPKTPAQQKAKDFWLLSFMLSGMNVKDICLLKRKNIIDNDKIEFIRAKTKNSKREKITITTFLNDMSTALIEKYGCEDKSPEAYVFDILQEGMTPQKQHAQVKNFTKFINQHLKILCTDNDLPGGVSTYWARHTWATLAVRSEKSLEFVQEALGHANLTTTQRYFAGFDDEVKKDFSKSLMNF